MSALVEFPPEAYNKHAFDGFREQSGFRIENALALMWFSQLAYETGQPDTIEQMRDAWQFDGIESIAKHVIFGTVPGTGQIASLDTRAIIGRRRGATFVAFGGTDALVWENFFSDFTIRRTPDTDIHDGFLTAFNAVKAKVEAAIRAASGPVFVTGHSLGAALGALAGLLALELRVEPTALYFFGMPRVGGERFAERYRTTPLDEKTYRLVHGLDIVARVPFVELGFFHVGRVMLCGSGKKFDRSGVPSAVGSNEPTVVTRLGPEVLGAFQRFATTGRFLSDPGPGPFGPLFRVLPQPIRDHLQDRYIAALTP